MGRPPLYGQGMATTVRYPDTPTEDVVEEAAGVRFPDPYRWLEETDAPKVRAWQEAQAQVASAYVRDWPQWDALRARVEHYTVARHATLPVYAGGSWFHEHAPEHSSYPRVIVSDEPYGEGRVLVDLEDYKVGEDLPFLSWIGPSPDGRVLAIGVCTDGSEQNTIRLIDVATGEQLEAPPQVLHDAWPGGVAWLPDSSGFYFLGLLGSVHEFEQAFFLHRVGQPAPTEPEDVPVPRGREYSLIQISADGRWAVACHRLFDVIPMAALDLTDPGAAWRPFVTTVTDTIAGHVVDGRYVAVTDNGADRGRLVAIPLDADDPNDPASWDVLVAESDANLRRVLPVGDYLYLEELVDTYSHVRILNRDGSPAGEVPLPAHAALDQPPFLFMTLSRPSHPDEYVFSYATLTRSPAICRHRPGDAAIDELRPPDLVLDATITDHWATSPDGARVPFHEVRSNAAGDGPAPALIYAYGGFNVNCVPGFPGWGVPAFIEAGGVFVHAHLRGGGEFGREWWEQGRFKNKQNCYRDLYAIAEDLVARGVTTTDLLALTGGSNGGLMCGVAVTQRPDLWKAVLPRVPIMDLVGSCRDPYDRWVLVSEFADVEDPDEIRRMAGFSPYHLVEEGTTYPAVFIEAGNTDPRCPPWHARKFAARMQAAQGGDAPILVHIWDKVGHGWATEKSIALDQSTENLAFLFKTLEMTV
jgi:prolyl oligopeptidase